jgi:hypothetical protein
MSRNHTTPGGRADCRGDNRQHKQTESPFEQVANLTLRPAN